MEIVRETVFIFIFKWQTHVWKINFTFKYLIFIGHNSINLKSDVQKMSTRDQHYWLESQVHTRFLPPMLITVDWNSS